MAKKIQKKAEEGKGVIETVDNDFYSGLKNSVRAFIGVCTGNREVPIDLKEDEHNILIQARVANKEEVSICLGKYHTTHAGMLNMLVCYCRRNGDSRFVKLFVTDEQNS